MAIGNIYFKQGTKEDYDLLEVKDNNTIYFLNDTKELYKGLERFSSGDLVSLLKDGLMSKEDKEALDNALVDIQAVEDSIDEINRDIDKEYVYDSGFEVQNSELRFVNSSKNIATGELSHTTKVVPKATTLNDGIMPDGTIICAFDSEGNAVSCDEVDEKGVFILDGLLAGDYVLKLISGGVLTSRWVSLSGDSDVIGL